MASPSWQWVVKPTPAGWSILSIGTGRGESQYLVQAIWDADGGCIGYRLVKRDGTAYDVCIEGHWTCDCPDATFRHDGAACKHITALRAALVAHERATSLLPSRRPTLSEAVAADFQTDL